MEGWMAEGRCRAHAPDLFFPSDGAGVALAQRVCRSCPVRRPCLEYALGEDIHHGVWGGTSERQRLRIRRDRITGRPAQPASRP